MSVYTSARRFIAPSPSTKWAKGLTTRNALRYSSSLSATAKYADKLQARLQEEGASSVEELKERLKETGKAFREPTISVSPLIHTKPKPRSHEHSEPSRKDSSGVKPLSSFLNVQEILKKQNTVDQISALWTLYHASKSGGTGRGYVSAALPLGTYSELLNRARKYPMFVVPLPKPDSVGEGKASDDTPVEFHVLQWNFHEPPSVPSALSEMDTFPNPPPPVSSKPNPPIATVIFTPLIQYKLHQSYAPPYMVLTFYTDLASPKELVLLRGEITPSSSVSENPAGNFMLSQQDAQLLVMALQKFYLPATGDEKAVAKSAEAEKLLKTFHEKPADFDWKALMKFVGGGLLM